MKIIISSWQNKDTEGWRGREKDKTSAFITSTKDSIILKKSSHCPAANHLPSTAGVHLGNKLRAAVLYSIHFLDQWLVKGHSHHTEARNPKGKCPSQVCTLPFLRFSFCCTQLIPRRQSKGVRLNSKDLRGSRTQTGGGNLLPRVSWLPRLVASHMICFSHQRERDCPRPLICFSHDLDLWVFAQRLSHGHKDIFLFFFFYCCLTQS